MSSGVETDSRRPDGRRRRNVYEGCLRSYEKTIIPRGAGRIRRQFFDTAEVLTSDHSSLKYQRYA